jgi:hypothetical protein
MKPSTSGRRISSCMAIQVPNPRDPAVLGVRLNDLEPVECARRIGEFARPAVPEALTAADTAKIEAQHGETTLSKRVIEAVDDLIVHGAPELGVGMQDQSDGAVARTFMMVAGFNAACGPIHNQFRHLGLSSSGSK